MSELRFLTSGESHGQALVTILEGIPAGLEISEDYIAADMHRRQGGYGRSRRQQLEVDRAQILAGVRHGRTLGSPIGMLIANRVWEDWQDVMKVGEYDGDPKKVTRLRPGHADLAGTMKFGLSDVRDVLERASARETAARVAGGALAKAFLRALDVQVFSHVIQINAVRAPARPDLQPEDFADVDESPVRSLDPDASAAMVEEINRLRKANESLGGVFEVRAYGVVPGLGSHVSWEERLDGQLGGALLSIHAMKGVGIGEGFEMAGKPGSEVHDEIFWSEERGYYRETNRAGGLEGGMTTGEPLILTAAMKPLPTLTKPLRSVDIATKEPAEALRERTDSTTVPAAAVVGEAMVGLVLADAYRRKFGGDHIDDVLAAVRAYRERIDWRR